MIATGRKRTRNTRVQTVLRNVGFQVLPEWTDVTDPSIIAE